jgi:hypothetical protein
MSRLSAFIKTRRRHPDAAPQTEATSDSEPDPPASAPPAGDADGIFDLLPPEPTQATAEPEPEPEPQGRNVHPVDMTDLSRLSIDRDGRLYWDGKPVEVRRRITMSPAQVVGATLVAVFVVIGAVASVVQGALAARELACRLGWSASACSPGAVQPRQGSDIPA